MEHRNQSQICELSATRGSEHIMFKVFEKYNMKDKAMLCLWHNGQLNTAIRESSCILELQDRLKEWLPEIEGGKGCQFFFLERNEDYAKGNSKSKYQDIKPMSLTVFQSSIYKSKSLNFTFLPPFSTCSMYMSRSNKLGIIDIFSFSKTTHRMFIIQSGPLCCQSFKEKKASST